MPPKRAATSDEEFVEASDGSDYENAPSKPVTKRARKSSASTSNPSAVDVSHILSMKKAELQKCDHSKLVAFVEALQQSYSSKNESVASTVLSEDKLDVEVEKARNLMIRAMTKSMTWKPSCKTGGSKVSYSGILVDERILPLMLGMDASARFKAKRMTEDEFQAKVGTVQGSARYNTLYLKGNVNIKWDQSARTFSVNGSYGK